MYGDLSKDEARFTSWAVRAIKKLTAEALRSNGKRFAVLNINKNLNSAVLPCDFKEPIFIGIIDQCGEKIELNINSNIVNNFNLPEVECDTPCEAKCDCYPKQMCADLQTTQVINKIKINDTEYDETVTKTLMPNGEYYQVTTTPTMDFVSESIEYITKKEYITAFDLETCGCIKKTERNCAKLEAVNWDVYCCYCTSCKKSSTDFGGYKIFMETGTIHFDGAFRYDKAYIEYRGSLPKSGNEYLVPEVASETVIHLTKFFSVQNKKGVPISEKNWVFNNYLRERGNMEKIMGRMSLADLLHSALLVPNFSYNSDGCYTPCSTSNSTYRNGYGTSTSTTTIINTGGGGGTTPTAQYPTIITFEGTEMVDGIYTNALIATAVGVRIFANPFNRFLTPTEFNILGGGQIEILTGEYGSGDWFDLFPKWI
jgi:hypothetical protein